MSEQIFKRFWFVAAAVVTVGSGVLAIWEPPLALSILAGGAWNLASLWCLARMLTAWIGPSPSRRRAVAWLLIKIGALYPAAWILLQSGRVSALGFGIGFTVALATVITAFVVYAQRLVLGRWNGQ